MPKKKKWRGRTDVWTPLERAYVSPAEIALTQEAFGLESTAIAEHLRGEMWKNDRYQVMRTEYPSDNGGPSLVSLSVRRLDRAPIRDWRDMQFIKNQLVGKECEGVELYPAESRLVDTSNQYWMWCIADPVFRFPIGFRERLVMSNPPGKARQRPLMEQEDK